MNALLWAVQSVVIVFALLSFTPILSVVLIGKLIVQTTLGISTTNLHAVARGGWLFPPLLLIRESAFWTLGGIAFISTFLLRLKHPA
jgi:hypothetical protein